VTSFRPTGRGASLRIEQEEPPVAYRYNLLGVRVLLVSADPKVREMMSLAVRSVERALRMPGSLEFFEAGDGLSGIDAAWRRHPDVVVADEFASRAGAFALAKDLTGAQPPFDGRIVILLERSQDAWLARWSGADVWFTKPVNPFELADAVAGFMTEGHKEVV
jgi:DNA-binding NarL/FixJ family response regulator